MRKTEEIILEKVNILFETFKPNSRVVCIQDSSDGVLKKGMKGTVQFIDDLGSICVNWDNGANRKVLFEEHYADFDELNTLETLNIFQNSQNSQNSQNIKISKIIKLCKEDSKELIQELKKEFDFYRFIDVLRDNFQHNTDYFFKFNGESQNLKFEEIEALMTYTMDQFLKNKEAYFSYVGCFKKVPNSNVIRMEKSEVGFYDEYQHCYIPINQLTDDLFVCDDLTQDLLALIKNNVNTIERHLFDIAQKSNFNIKIE